MTETILNQIISYKKKWISKQIEREPINILQSKVHTSQRNFYSNLFNKKNKTIFILECKKSSPSKGIICKHFNPTKIAHAYKKYASVISVLTDQKYFNGNFNILRQMSTITTKPILCKDFFISEWQIYFARYHQADAILLMLSILDDKSYQKLATTAHKLRMGILTEIINEEELKRAEYLKAKVIGINNRNLHDLSINLDRTINLSKKISKDKIIISESGILNSYHIKKLKKYVHGFLIGTALMSQSKLDTAINKLMLGENKICGLTRVTDARIAHKLGAVYGGLIFVPSSPRYIHIITAQRIVYSVKNLNYVGVFKNENISYITRIVNTLKLSVVQLHGTEDQKYINILRKKIPITCHIWKSINMNQKILPKINLLHINRYLLDNGSGGTGTSFSWNLVSNLKLKNKSILAGGLTPNNCIQAAKIGCVGLDFNSGVETKPGIKNHQKLIQVFRILRTMLSHNISNK